MIKVKTTQKIYTSASYHTTSMQEVHYHNTHELYYLKKGNVTYYIGERIYYAQQGTFIFIPKGLLHKTYYEPNSYTEHTRLQIEDTIFFGELREIRESLLQSRTIQIPPSALVLMDDILCKIRDETAATDNCSPLLISLHIKELLLLLYRHKQNYKQTEYGTDKISYSISKYISSNIQEDLSLERLSQAFNLSETYLSRKFKDNIGISLSDYIAYARVAHAERLLLETSLPITEVAHQSGFSDSNYFSTVFKRIRGISPLQFRKTAKPTL